MSHPLFSALLAATTSTTTHASSKSGSSSSYIFFVIILVFVGVYFLVLRPRQRRVAQQQTGNTTLDVGDEVISAGGILGTVVAIAGDEVVVEVAPGQTMTFWRRAINLRSAVRGAPQGSTVTTSDEPYSDESYSDESYSDERYDGDGEDESYEEDYQDEDGAEPEGAADTHDDQDQHDIPGGTSEGR